MSETGRPPVYVAGAWEIDLGRRALRLDGEPVPLGGRAFDLLAVLVRAAGDLVSKDTLMAQVWPGAIVEEGTLQVHISAIRKALGSARGMLQTNSGRGYRLLGDWHERQGQAPDTARLAPLPSTPSFSSNIPVAHARLVGRETIMQTLRDLASAYRVLTLTGPGAIGKTALALQLARDVFAGFGGDRIAVELASVTSANMVPSAVAGALDLTVAGDVISAQAVARAIGDRKLLLVLDNCEHVIDAVAELSEAVLRRCRQTTVLTTSREVMRIDGECVFRVPPLDVPPQDDDDPDHLLGNAAVRLFIARTTALQSDFRPDRGTLPIIAAICRRLDGVPLAIEFAAARTATLGLREVADRLDDRFRLLTGGRRTALPRHQTLRAALDWSYELLPVLEQRLLRRIAICAGSFTLDATLAVMVDCGYAECDLLDGIGALVSKSLLMLDGATDLRRWRMLETIRAYALERLAEHGETAVAARNHAVFYRDLFEAAEASGSMMAKPAGLSAYARELDNVRAALDWAFSPNGDARLGVALTVAIVPLLTQLSLLTECRDRAERALATLGDDPADDDPRMRLSAALGWSLMYGIGRARETAAAWTVTLELAERLDNAEYRRHALWGLCIDQFNTGNVRTALSYAERFAADVGPSARGIEQMMASRIRATALHYLGDQRSARRHIDAALAQADAVSSETRTVSAGFDLLVSTHYFQARILWLQGFADQALQVVAQNVAEGQTGATLPFCSVLGQSACPISLLSGDLDAAERYGAMLLEHTERNPVRLWHLWARCFNGLLACRRGDVDAGLPAMREALERAGEAQLLPRFLLLRGEYARLLGEIGMAGDAIEIADRMIAACQARDEGWYIPELLHIKAVLLLKQDGSGLPRDAETLLLRAMHEAECQGALAWALRAAISLAELWIGQGRETEARERLARVYGRFSEGYATSDLQAAGRLLRRL